MRKNIMVLFGVAALGLVGGATKNVDANGVLGNTALLQWVPNALNCFAEGYGQIITKGTGDKCTDGRLFKDIPLIIPLFSNLGTWGYHDITIRGRVGGAGLAAKPACFWAVFGLSATYPSYTGGAMSAWAPVPGGNNPYEQSTGRANTLGDSQGLEVYCYMQYANQALSSVTWYSDNPND